MEAPACPVCLQAYDPSSALPRVLPCGHTFCELCIASLPQRFPGTIRCPLCAELVKYLAPSSFPKNIDLLGLSLQYLNQETREPVIKDRFSGSVFRTCNSVSSFEEWIVPRNVIDTEVLEHADDLLLSKLVSHHSFSRFPAKAGQAVTLLPLHVAYDNALSGYMPQISAILTGMDEEEKTELALIFRISSQQQRVCTCYGLWYWQDKKSLYLASERNNLSLCEKLDELGSTLSKDEVGLHELSCFSMIGMEICEILFGLHKEGLILGCFNPSSLYFYDLGSICVDLCDVMVVVRKIHNIISDGISGDGSAMDIILMKILKFDAFLSPEVLRELLRRKGIACNFSSCSIGKWSDVWSLGCILLNFLFGKEFIQKLVSFVIFLFSSTTSGVETCSKWKDTVAHLLKSGLGEKYVQLSLVLSDCMQLDPNRRPVLRDIWKCLRGLIVHPQYDISWDETEGERGGGFCLLLGKLCEFSTKNDLVKCKASCVSKFDHVGSLCHSISSGKFEILDIQGHLDSVTGFAVGGDFLFSSSFDKTVRVWSLQNFKLVHCLRGHEHRITAVVYIDNEQPLCISADVGGIIFVWSLGESSSSQDPVKKLCEPKDWRYTGIHAMAVSLSGYLYTGSGDKSIKVWSLQNHEVIGTMMGHSSLVSTLAVRDTVLYSGSWDGTVRLWSILDHSPLAVLSNEQSRNVIPVLCMSVDNCILAVAHQDGCIKIWKDDLIVKSFRVHNGVVCAVHARGHFLFTGGWDKTLKIQEVMQEGCEIDLMQVGSVDVNSAVRAVNYSHGKLVAGFSDGSIKVFTK